MSKISNHPILAALSPIAQRIKAALSQALQSVRSFYKPKANGYQSESLEIPKPLGQGPKSVLGPQMYRCKYCDTKFIKANGHHRFCNEQCRFRYQKNIRRNGVFVK